MQLSNSSTKLTLLFCLALLATWVGGNQLLRRSEGGAQGVVRAATDGAGETGLDRDGGGPGIDAGPGAPPPGPPAAPAGGRVGTAEPAGHADEGPAADETSRRTADAPADPPRRSPVRVRGQVLARGEGLRTVLDWRPVGATGDEEVRVVETDASGAYAVTLTRGGPHLVRVLPSGFLDEVGTQGLELVVEVPADAVARLTLELPTGRLNGRVVDGDGNPVEDTFLELVAGDASFGRVDDDPRGRRTMSDQDGRFRFDFLAPGTYAVATTSDAADVGGPEDGGELQILGAPVEVPADGQVEIELGLPRDVLRPRVRVVRDGLPVFGATVLLLREDAPSLPPLDVGTTGRDGGVTLPGLDAGLPYALRATTASAVSSTVPVPTDADPVELVLAPAGRLAVRAVGPDGRPAPATIEVHSLDPGQPLWARTTPFDPAPLGERLPVAAATPLSPSPLGPLPAGSYRVEARTRDGRAGRAIVAVEARTDGEVQQVVILVE